MVKQHYRWDFIGLSTDEKPTPQTSENVVDGSTFYCSDTSKLYVFCKNTWYERKPLGEGGGGTTYTAGFGIDIANNEISVDDTEVQPKLTAGENITIENNTISAAGGGSITPVQTTGTSTTDVMSQDATTKMVYKSNNSGSIRIGDGADVNAAFSNVAIGQSATANAWYGIALGNLSHCIKNYSIAIGASAGSQSNKGEYSVSIGSYAHANQDNAITIRGVADGENSIAIGYGSHSTEKGQFDIGTSNNPGKGYSSSDYRLLTGLYDGQNAHDAVTVGQVNSVIDAINTALSTNIPHIGA